MCTDDEMADLTTHLTHKVVRDLCWAMKSPHLLPGTILLPVLSDETACRITNESYDWLLGLDLDPRSAYDCQQFTVCGCLVATSLECKRGLRWHANRDDELELSSPNVEGARIMLMNSPWS